jgi:hypothetical protein
MHITEQDWFVTLVAAQAAGRSVPDSRSMEAFRGWCLIADRMGITVSFDNYKMQFVAKNTQFYVPVSMLS